jgi:hypothetical protein
MLQPMPPPLRLEVLLKLKPGIPTYGCSPDPQWMRGRTYNGILYMGFSHDTPTHRIQDFLGWAPLGHTNATSYFAY